MALGGGIWTTQNKKLPGAYINFISAARASATVSDRGYAAMGLTLDWGPDNEVFTVTSGDLQKRSMALFGYDYSHEKLRGLRDLFKHATVLYAYKLNSSAEGKADGTYATARWAGARGNDLTIVISKDADDETKFVVKTLLDGAEVDRQTVKEAAELTANEYVTFKDQALEETAGDKLTGGESAEVTVKNHQDFLDKIEGYAFNALGVVSDETGDNAVKVNALYAAFVKRLRDEMGVKFQVVAYRTPADYEGVVNVENKAVTPGCSAASLVYWVTGVVAGTAVNASALNLAYDGEFAVEADATQQELEAALDAGKFVLHRDGNTLRVLADINSLVTVSEDKNELFRQNQAVRVMDEIGTSIAAVFKTKYLGKVPNDAAGRVSLWADIVAHHRQLQTLRAIQNFDEANVVVSPGETPGAVVVDDAVEIAFAMEKLYMTCVIQ